MGSDAGAPADAPTAAGRLARLCGAEQATVVRATATIAKAFFRQLFLMFDLFLPGSAPIRAALGKVSAGLSQDADSPITVP